MKTAWVFLAGLAAAAVLGGAALLIWKVLTDWAGWIEMHPAAVGAVATGGSAVVVLLAAALAFWGARLQGQSALEAARAQINHEKLLKQQALAEEVRLMSTLLLLEVQFLRSTISYVRDAFKPDALKFWWIDLEFPIYRNSLNRLPIVGHTNSSIIVNFYNLLGRANYIASKIMHLHSEKAHAASINSLSEELEHLLNFAYSLSETIIRELPRVAESSLEAKV